MDDFQQIVSENERCLNENRALRSKLQLVKENSSLRVANILSEVLTWIDHSAASQTTGVDNSQQSKAGTTDKEWSRFQGEQSTSTREKYAKPKPGSPSTIVRNSPTSTGPRKSLFKNYIPKNNGFKSVVSSVTTPENQEDSNKTSSYSRNNANVTTNVKSPVNVSDSEQLEDISPAEKIPIRSRRGSIIYDMGDIKLNVQESEGFKSIQETDIPAENMERSKTPEVTNRTHGHVWTKSGLTPTPIATSTPIKNTQNLRASKDTRRRSPSPVGDDYSSMKTIRRSPSPSSNSRKSGRSNSRPRSSRVISPTTPEAYDTGIARNSNYSSNASFSDRGRNLRSVTPSSRKNRSPHPGYHQSYASVTSDAETSGFHSDGSNDVSVNGVKVTPATKLLGEIAFQLDRKILNYVFDAKKKKRRFYGYIILNIPEKIRRESTIPGASGLVDAEKKQILEYRYHYILNTLKPLGYRLDHHPDFCADMVNKYGLLPLPPDKPSGGITADQKQLVLETVRNITPREELHDMTVVLECLALLAKDDNSAIISF